MCLAIPALAQERVDLGIVDRIKTEAFAHSKVMDHLYQLSEIHGPRLTGSPEFDDAARWAVGRLQEIGVENVHLEKWGPFGRSWSIQQFSVEQLEPRYSLLNAAPLAWSAPTAGPVSGDLVLAPLSVSLYDGPKKVKIAMDEFRAKWTGKLRGKIVLLNAPKIPAPQTNPQFPALDRHGTCRHGESPHASSRDRGEIVERRGLARGTRRRRKAFRQFERRAVRSTIRIV